MISEQARAGRDGAVLHPSDGPCRPALLACVDHQRRGSVVANGSLDELRAAHGAGEPRGHLPATDPVAGAGMSGAPPRPSASGEPSGCCSASRARRAAGRRHRLARDALVASGVAIAGPLGAGFRRRRAVFRDRQPRAPPTTSSAPSGRARSPRPRRQGKLIVGEDFAQGRPRNGAQGATGRRLSQARRALRRSRRSRRGVAHRRGTRRRRRDDRGQRARRCARSRGTS